MHAQGRHWTLAALVPALALIAACSGYDSPTYPGTTTPPPAPAVRLKEVVIDRLPNFEWQALMNAINEMFLPKGPHCF